MVGFPEVLLVAAMLFILVGSLTNWWAAVMQMLDGGPLLPACQRNNVSWGLVDLGIIVVIVALIAGMGVAMVTSSLGIEDASAFDEMPPSERAKVFLVFGVASLLAAVFSLGWLWLRYQRIDGFAAQQLGPDIELGIRWFMMLVVPVVLIQLVLTRWFPTRHPLIEMLRESGDLSFLPIAAYAAVVSAPLCEELFFRLFAQTQAGSLHRSLQLLQPTLHE